MALNQGAPDWWRKAVLYQVYPRSFQDSNGDGIGDLKGIEQRLGYLSDLGVDAIWISPFFKSPMRDFGYDVEDHRAVDPIFGDLNDFKRLLDAAHRRGIRVMIDLVLSHASETHEWFRDARLSTDSRYSDCFVWADARPDGGPPNNWLSIFGGPAWTWEPRRRQYYLHNFLSSQPDLNFHNPVVQQEALDVARWWLELGVDGFRLDTVNFYFHNVALKDNPPSGRGRTQVVSESNPYGFQEHLYDKNQPEVLNFLDRLGNLLAEYPGSMALGEVGAERAWADQLMEAYSAPGRLQLCYTFDLLSDGFSPDHFRRVIGIQSGTPLWRCLSFSNHDVVRAATRFSRDESEAPLVSKLAMALLLSLPGTPCLYQGDELGLTEADVPFDKLVDPYGITFWPTFKGRDGCRTPMPWNTGPNAGFTTRDGVPWLPISEDHPALSVSEQETAESSVLTLVKDLIRIRKTELGFAAGEVRFYEMEDGILMFDRVSGEDVVTCVFNLSRTRHTVQLDPGPIWSIVLGQQGASIGSNERLELPPLAWAYLKSGSPDFNSAP
ncbi:MAG: alpha-amylase family glycosyl hydrolase [Myxococcota bacterium]|nr:alpha-amylase family glycosyl hydrolase [Myxococcota bacterium]